MFKIWAGAALSGLTAGVPIPPMNFLRGDARFEPGPEFRFVKLLADEDQLAQPLLAGVPAVVEFESFLVGPDHQLMVNVEGAKFVDDGTFVPMLLRQQVVEERGFARAQKT